MKFTQELASDILTGLESGAYEQYADEDGWAKGDEEYQEAVDTVAELVGRAEFGKVGKYVLLAAAEYIEDLSSNTEVHELSDFLQEHYKGSGYSVAKTLEDYAASLDGTGHGLYKLYDELDRAGGVDYFDWEKYADSGSTYMSGLTFLVIPATGVGADSVFLFEE